MQLANESRGGIFTARCIIVLGALTASCEGDAKLTVSDAVTDSPDGTGANGEGLQGGDPDVGLGDSEPDGGGRSGGGDIGSDTVFDAVEDAPLDIADVVDTSEQCDIGPNPLPNDAIILCPDEDTSTWDPDATYDDADGGPKCAPPVPAEGFGPGTFVVAPSSLQDCGCWPDGDFCEGYLDSNLFQDDDYELGPEYACPLGEICNGDTGTGHCFAPCEVAWDCNCATDWATCKPVTDVGARCPEGFTCYPDQVIGTHVQHRWTAARFGICVPNAP